MTRAASGGRRRIVSVTGSRADYGLMQPVHRAIAEERALELHLLVTGMHLLPQFASSLAEVRADRFGALHELAVPSGEEGGKAMAQSIGQGIAGSAELLAQLAPDLLLLHGDRSEMLAAAIAAAHMNVAIVHMSGGDRSGSIDDDVRGAISKLAHFHLTSCAASTRRLVQQGEAAARIVEVGDPALDQLRTLDYLPRAALEEELGLPPGKPYLVATLHPVTDEAAHAAEQITTVLEALAAAGLPVVFTYPNSDAGGRAMRETLESWRSRPFLRVVADLGSRRYLSLLRHAAAMVGNSSSGIIEAPSLHLAAVNVGSRQTGRERAANVVDAPFEVQAIRRAIDFALHDPGFRRDLAACKSPYGDGHAAERTAGILRRLRIGTALTAKWRAVEGSFLDA